MLKNMAAAEHLKIEKGGNRVPTQKRGRGGGRQEEIQAPRPELDSRYEKSSWSRRCAVSFGVNTRRDMVGKRPPFMTAVS